MSVNMKYVVRKSPDGVGYIIIAAREIKTTVGVVAKGTVGGSSPRGKSMMGKLSGMRLCSALPLIAISVEMRL